MSSTRLTYCANDSSMWEMLSHNAYLDSNTQTISIRRIDGNGNYAKAGVYYPAEFRSHAISAKYLQSFYGMDVVASDCNILYRISTDGGSSWQYFDTSWHTIGGTGFGNNTFAGNITLNMLVGNNDPAPSEWMDENKLHEGLMSLSPNEKNVAVWLRMSPENQENKPLFKNMSISMITERENFFNDTVRSISLMLQNEYYFDDRIVPEIDRNISYKIPYCVRTDDAGSPMPASKITEYVRAYNLDTDPNRLVNVVDSWDSEGNVTFTAPQEGFIEIDFGHQPPVHIETKPFTQLSEEVAIVMSDFRVEEWGPYEEFYDVNWYNLMARHYTERWAEFDTVLICMAHRTEQSVRMMEGIRRTIENTRVRSEGLGCALKLVSFDEGVSMPSEIGNQLSVVEVPLRYGRGRSIGNITEKKLGTDIGINVVLLERVVQYEGSRQ